MSPTTPPPSVSEGIAVSPTQVSPSPQVQPLVEVNENAGSNSLSVIGTLAAAITAPPAVPQTVSPVQLGAQPGCTPYHPCNIFFQYVGVYFWEQEGQNSSCNGAMPAPPAPPGLQLPQDPGGVVAVFTSIRASDGCQQIGTTFDGHIATFAPGELSSIRDSSTYSFNLADFPCPPASVHWTRPLPYEPIIAPPPFLFNLDPAWSTCIAGAGQGIDPPAAFKKAPGGSGRGDAGALGRHRRAVHPHARAVPWAAAKTTKAA
ncbi:MAG: hypothetical protein Q9164_006304 [Protoblastenia rupestris]